MKENPRKIPTKKYPDKNIPLKDPDPTMTKPDEPKEELRKNPNLYYIKNEPKNA